MEKASLWKVTRLVKVMRWMLLLSSSLLIFGHVLPSLPPTVALAHSHSHSQHHHHPHHHHSTGNTDGGGALTLISTNSQSNSKDEENTTPNSPPWSNIIPVRGSKSNRVGGSSGREKNMGACRSKRCGVGRECRLSESSGVAECNCISECRKGGRKSNNKPVCGTDGRLYASYCDLRRTACLTGAHIFFSHYYQREQQHHHYSLRFPKYNPNQQQHRPAKDEDDEEDFARDGDDHANRYQQHHHPDFTLGVDGDSNKNGSTSYINHKHNIIPASGGHKLGYQDPQCFQPHNNHNQHHDQNHPHQQRQLKPSYHYHHHYDPDKNALQSKDQGFIQSQSQSAPLQQQRYLSSSERAGVVVGQPTFIDDSNGGNKGKDEIYSSLEDDDEEDEEETQNDDYSSYQNSFPIGITTTTTTTSEQPQRSALGVHPGNRRRWDEGKKYEDEDFDVGDIPDNDGQAIVNNRRTTSPNLRIQDKRQDRSRPEAIGNYFTGSHNPDDTVAELGRATKGRKISSRGKGTRANGEQGVVVDSDRRQILDDDGHSSSHVLAPSSYYDFMWKQKQQPQPHKPKLEDDDDDDDDDGDDEEVVGRMGRKKNKLEFSWRKEDFGEDEMSDQAFPHDEKSAESLEPSAATNLAWRGSSLQRGKEGEKISKRRGFHGDARDDGKDGHWDDDDGDHPPVKKDSSFPENMAHDELSKGRGSFAASRRQHYSPGEVSSSNNSGRIPIPPVPTSMQPKSTVCSPQDYEILKGELFQYDMAKLMKHIKMMMMTSVANEVAPGAAGPDAAAVDESGRYTRDNDAARDMDADDDHHRRKAPWSDMIMSEATSSPSPPPAPWLTSVEGDGPEADKDNLLRHIFTLLDQNHDSILEYVELYKAELENRLELRSPEKTSCQFRDFLLFDDTDHDGQLHLNEFFSSFSHFYDITMISLDKALETKTTRVTEGESATLECDITGSPPPYIQWKRYGMEVSQMGKGLGIKTNIDGSLSLTNVHMSHAGHYSCQSPRNPEVVQTHILAVESIPYVVITPKASWKRPGEDLLLICRVLNPIMDSSEEAPTGQAGQQGPSSESLVNWTWLFNGIPLRELPKSSSDNNNNNNKYIFENSSSTFGQGNGNEDMIISRLRIQEVYFQDMGSYECRAETRAGTGSATASLVVIDPNSKPEMQALHNTNARQLLVFHRNGLASYSAEHCGWLWEIFGDDVLQYPKDKDGARAVCDQFHSLCDWSEAVQVSPNYVYALQPSLSRLLLIDVGAVQSVGNAVTAIDTCRNPVKMEYVPYTDQLWISCVEEMERMGTMMMGPDKNGPKTSSLVLSIVENASRGRDHHQQQQNSKAIQFPLQKWDASARGLERITQIYLPSHQDEKLGGRKDCQFGFLSLSNEEQSLRKIDLKTFTYQRVRSSHLNLTKFSCIPHQIHFSLSCTISIINCLDPQTKSPNGQLVVDMLSNSVRFKTGEISGFSIASPNNRILLTEKHVGNTTHVFVQRIGVYEVSLLSHFLISRNISNIRIVHSMLTGAYASVAKLETGKEVVLSLQTGELQSVDDLLNQVPHSNEPSSNLYPADNAFPLNTEKSVIVMDAETLRPRCKFYEEIPELQSFLTVQS